MTTPKPLWLALAPAMFLCLWSMGYVVAKIGLQYAEPMTLLVLRYAAVVVIMAVLFLVLRPPLPTPTGAMLRSSACLSRRAISGCAISLSGQASRLELSR